MLNKLKSFTKKNFMGLMLVWGLGNLGAIAWSLNQPRISQSPKIDSAEVNKIKAEIRDYEIKIRSREIKIRDYEIKIAKNEIEIAKTENELIKNLLSPDLKEVRSYVKENIEQIIRKQESTLGIFYFQHPQVNFAVDIYQHNSNCSPLSLLGNVAIYGQGIIHIDESYFDVNDVDHLKSTLNHELMHAYLDDLLKLPIIRSNNYLNNLVDEGITLYYANLCSPTVYAPEKTDKKWYECDYEEVCFYDLGYHLVKPILDQYGQTGLTYLMINPPTDLDDLDKYQTNALQELEEIVK